MKDILENVTIIYKNGLREIFNAISIVNRGVYTGQIKKINNNDIEFVNHSFIPKDQIDRILIFNSNGESKNIDFNKEIGRK